MQEENLHQIGNSNDWFINAVNAGSIEKFLQNMNKNVLAIKQLKNQHLAIY